ncbi:hypothetical protein B10172_14940 [Campylobacter jejuni]|nr:hypothetical protein B10172_14940 [Campylobacter jejuni]
MPIELYLYFTKKIHNYRIRPNSILTNQQTKNLNVKYHYDASWVQVCIDLANFAKQQNNAYFYNFFKKLAL